MRPFHTSGSAVRAAAVALPALLALVVGCSGSSSPTDPGVPTPTPTPAASTARYRVTFTGLWAASTHPDAFPARAHFTGLIGAVHGDGVRFWEEGGLATRGIQDMAERGRKSPLDAEVMAAIDAGTALAVLSGDGVDPNPGSTTLEFEASRAFPRVTLTSMIGPSPDWFVGVAGLSLLEGDAWRAQVAVDLYPWDAGTDDGASFESANAPSTPHRPIRRLTGAPVAVGGAVPAFARFVFTRI